MKLDQLIYRMQSDFLEECYLNMPHKHLIEESFLDLRDDSPVLRVWGRTHRLMTDAAVADTLRVKHGKD